MHDAERQITEQDAGEEPPVIPGHYVPGLAQRDRPLDRRRREHQGYPGRRQAQRDSHEGANGRQDQGKDETRNEDRDPDLDRQRFRIGPARRDRLLHRDGGIQR